MRDLYEAAERHSATLAMYLEHLARRRGWSARTLSGMMMDVPPGTGRMMMVYGTSLLLPGGKAASFTPAPRPRVDGKTWQIDIRRSDGASRPAWNLGILIKHHQGAYQMFFGAELLEEATLERLLEALGTP